MGIIGRLAIAILTTLLIMFLMLLDIMVIYYIYILLQYDLFSGIAIALIIVFCILVVYIKNNVSDPAIDIEFGKKIKYRPNKLDAVLIRNEEEN